MSDIYEIAKSIQKSRKVKEDMIELKKEQIEKAKIRLKIL